MQLKKEEVRQNIMQAAKKEFLDKGFEKVSVREIARVAGVSTGSIYVYFKNKEEIFDEIVKPAIEMMRRYLGSEHIDGSIKKNKILKGTSLEENKGKVEELFIQVEKYRKELTLLFFCAGGSSYKNYKEEIIQLYVGFMIKYFKIFEELNGKKMPELSEPFMHALAGFYVSTIEEIITHVDSDKTRDMFIEQLGTYLYYGFKGLIGSLLPNNYIRD